MESTYPPAMLELAARHLDAAADQVRITPLTGDASTRVYLRAAAAGRTLVVCLYGEPFDESERAVDRLARMEAVNPSARLTYHSNALAHIEATRLFIEAGLPVPRILATSGADGLMLFEDVGDMRLQDWMTNRPAAEVRDAYRRAADLIVDIQSATKLALEADSICSHMAFDEAKLRWELGFFFANFINRYLKLKLDPATANAMQADFKSLCGELAACPRVLVHRDYHARNLMMKDERMFIIDHQDARMGPASYDVASLISDPYATLDAELMSELVERFIEGKARSAQPLDAVTEFRRELRLMTVQRMLKALGTYASQAALGNMTYVPYIGPARDRALAAMRELDRFAATRALLERAEA
ncbi:MAG TPA: phosphotransferase [Blastocatellia bacterium]|nr:phosphotransferase [Blastocatellia bacterium]